MTDDRDRKLDRARKLLALSASPEIEEAKAASLACCRLVRECGFGIVASGGDDPSSAGAPPPPSGFGFGGWDPLADFFSPARRRPPQESTDYVSAAAFAAFIGPDVVASALINTMSPADLRRIVSVMSSSSRYREGARPSAAGPTPGASDAPGDPPPPRPAKKKRYTVDRRRRR